MIKHIKIKAGGLVAHFILISHLFQQGLFSSWSLLSLYLGYFGLDKLMTCIDFDFVYDLLCNYYNCLFIFH